MFDREYAVINGKDTRDFGVYLIGGNIHDLPERDILTYQVPGRSGDLSVDNGRWNNISIIYTFAAYDDGLKKIGDFRAYLLSQTGYCRIETSLEKEYFRKGIVRNASSPQMSLDGGGGYMEVAFDCAPQKFLKSGEIEITNPVSISGLVTGYYLHNPTRYDAKPLFYVEPSTTESRTFIVTQRATYWNEANSSFSTTILKATTVTVAGATSAFYIDCEACDVYSITGANFNQYVTFTYDTFPVFYGNNIPRKLSEYTKYVVSSIDIAITGLSSFTKLTVIPRWWTL